MTELGAAMAAHPRIVSLDLSHNELGDDGAALLADAVLRAAAPSLTALSVAANGIRAAGAAALAASLDSNATLRYLDLGANDLGDDGARALADALARLSWCQLLRELDVSSQAAAVGATARKGLRAAAARRSGFRLVLRPKGDRLAAGCCLPCVGGSG